MELILSVVTLFLMGTIVSIAYIIYKVFFAKKNRQGSKNHNPSSRQADVPVSSSVKNDSSKLADQYHYIVNRNLFTRSEALFFQQLEEALEGELRIFGKVRIADVLSVRKGLTKREWGFQFGRIKAKHFDYVLCDPDTLKVVCAIELDDSSHQRPDRVKRDDFVNAICDETGLKLHRFKVAMHYDVENIRERIFPSKPSVRPISPKEVLIDLKQSLETTPDLLPPAKSNKEKLSGGNPWLSS